MLAGYVHGHTETLTLTVEKVGDGRYQTCPGEGL